MDNRLSIPERWLMLFDERQRKHVAFCETYVRQYAHGAPGHMDMMVISLLLGCLVNAESYIEELNQMLAETRAIFETPE